MVSVVFKSLPSREMTDSTPGGTGYTNSWIRVFLGNYSQQVVMNCQASSPAVVMSGVPQGTVLGPLLFLLYINDITKGLHSMTILLLRTA